MPIERRTARMQTTTLVISVVALVAALLLGFLVLRHATGSNSTVKINLGTDIFQAGNAGERAAAIAKAGPLLFSDVSGGGQDRPIFVNHLGHDAKTGWVALDAVPPDAPDGCFLEWDAKAKQFRGVKRVRGRHLSGGRRRAHSLQGDRQQGRDPRDRPPQGARPSTQSRRRPTTETRRSDRRASWREMSAAMAGRRSRSDHRPAHCNAF